MCIRDSGRVARFLDGSTQFGIELDSLSDFISFGVAPAIVVYLWSLSSFPKLGWSVAMLYAVCLSLRLARFNAMADKDLPKWQNSYFRGIAAPTAAGAPASVLNSFLYFTLVGKSIVPSVPLKVLVILPLPIVTLPVPLGAILIFPLDDDIIELHLENAKTFLLDEEFISEKNGEFLATRFGQKVSRLYIDPLTARDFRNAIEYDITKGGDHTFGFLHLITTCQEFFPIFDLRQKDLERASIVTVSYTHLTLPTILLV